MGIYHLRSTLVGGLSLPEVSAAMSQAASYAYCLVIAAYTASSRYGTRLSQHQPSRLVCVWRDRSAQTQLT